MSASFLALTVLCDRLPSDPVRPERCSDGSVNPRNESVMRSHDSPSIQATAATL